MPKCEVCNDTGWYGDNGPGIKGNTEYNPCDYCQCQPKPAPTITIPTSDWRRLVERLGKLDRAEYPLSEAGQAAANSDWSEIMAIVAKVEAGNGD